MISRHFCCVVFVYVSVCFVVMFCHQVTLYSMMMSDRRRDPNGGLLLYLREGDMKSVPAEHANKRGN